MNIDMDDLLSMPIACKTLYHILPRMTTKPPPTVQFADLTTCFVRACEKGDTAVVELLLKQYNADPSEGIWAACFRNRADILQLLLEHKGDPNRGILTACGNGNTDIVKLLLTYNADPRIGMREACKNGYSAIVEMLKTHA